jgi:L-ascorbate metabolism protein UlaG (beta-lactamase superfamily)
MFAIKAEVKHPKRESFLSYIGGPTALLDLRGFRLITDPTFDAAGAQFPSPTGSYALEKTMSPAIAAENLGRIDAVLLSHDHHPDNLDSAGRNLLRHATRVLTTVEGAERLDQSATGLRPWDSVVLESGDGRDLRVTATPARHGPHGGDRGPVIGFVVESSTGHPGAIYITGDTVWYEGVADVAARFSVTTVIAFMGAARVAAAGQSHLTLTAEEGVEVARAFPNAMIIPLHFEGWKHFSEGRQEIQKAFANAKLEARLRWPHPDRPIRL